MQDGQLKSCCTLNYGNVRNNVAYINILERRFDRNFGPVLKLLAIKRFTMTYSRQIYKSSGIDSKNLPLQSPRITGAAIPSSTMIVATNSKSSIFLVVALLTKRFKEIQSDFSSCSASLSCDIFNVTFAEGAIFSTHLPVLLLRFEVCSACLPGRTTVMILRIQK